MADSFNSLSDYHSDWSGALDNYSIGYEDEYAE